MTVSDAQVEAVLNLHERPVVIALDGDTAGADGTDRWLAAICLQRDRLALTSRLPNNLDPADWLQLQGDSGLTSFDRCHCLDPQTTQVIPHLPGRELVRLAVASGRDPVQQAVSVVLPLAMKLQPQAAAELLNQAESEMTREGWNPNGVFLRTIHDSVQSAWREGQTQKSLSNGLALSRRLSTDSRPVLPRASPDAHRRNNDPNLSPGSSDTPRHPSTSSHLGVTMDTTTFASALLDKAASHLRAAAQHADNLSDRDADGASSLWSALAGQLRLVGAVLSPTAPPAQITPRPFGIHDHLDAALASLDRIGPLDGPPDLQLWAWRVVDLRAVLDTMDSLP